MFLTDNLLENYFDNSFAIKRMNRIIRSNEVSHDDEKCCNKIKNLRASIKNQLTSLLIQKL